MDLSVITVTWNSAELIAEQIKSVRLGCRNISFEEIVVDNASTDGTVSVVEKQSVIPAKAGIHVASSNGLDSRESGNDNGIIGLIKNDRNTGFAYPNNQAAKIAKGDFLLFLNPDMRVQEGSLDVMVQWMKNYPDVGLASCKLVDEHGNINEDAKPRRFPGLLDQAALILKIPHIFPGVLNRYLFKDFNQDKEQEVDSVRGSFMIMRREVYEKLGWAFDPRYFIWFEDVDLCREVTRLGFKVMYTPVITCVDYVGQSFKKRTTLWKQKQFTKSMAQYFKKWEPWYKWATIALLRPAGIVMAWGNDVSHNLKCKNQKLN